MKEKILDILKDAIKTFDEIKEIKLIATFGSITKLEYEHFDDVDLITISNKSVHYKFINYLVSLLKRRNLEPIIFETIVKKPQKTNDRQVLIHDLHYLSLRDLKKKEWKSVINTMKKDIVIWYGDKNFRSKLPFYKITKKELLNPIYRWVLGPSSEKKFRNFQQYISKIIPKLIEDYKYLNPNNLKLIQKKLNQKIPWRQRQKEVIRLLKQEIL